MPMFIPKRAVCLSSSIAHYERWLLMRATLLPPPFASEPRLHLTRRCSEPQAAVMTSSQHVYEVRPSQRSSWRRSNFRCPSFLFRLGSSRSGGRIRTAASALSVSQSNLAG